MSFVICIICIHNDIVCIIHIFTSNQVENILVLFLVGVFSTIINMGNIRSLARCRPWSGFNYVIAIAPR